MREQPEASRSVQSREEKVQTGHGQGHLLGAEKKEGEVRREQRENWDCGLLLVLKKAGRRGESWDSLGGVWEVRRARGQHGL